MKRVFTIISCLLVVILLFSNFGFAYANDIPGHFRSLNMKFLDKVNKKEWIHYTAVNEFKSGHTDQKEVWYRLGPNGKVKEAYEWTTFGDPSIPAQESMYKNGHFSNATVKQKWQAAEFDLDLASEFRDILSNIAAKGGNVSQVETVYNGLPAFKFSIETPDNTIESVRGFRLEYYLDSSTGTPLAEEVYKLYTDGSEELGEKSTYTFDFDLSPNVEKIKKVSDKVDKEEASYVDPYSPKSAGMISPMVTTGPFATTYKKIDTPVGGITVSSYKDLYPTAAYWGADIYTGTGNIPLQWAGTDWWSFQEKCDGTIYPTETASSGGYVIGASHWYKRNSVNYGYFYHNSGCGNSHQIWNNGQHEAKYNGYWMTIQTFSIYKELKGTPYGEN